MTTIGKRCPHCRRLMAIQPTRICAQCQVPMPASHKYILELRVVKGKTWAVVVHRNCQKPEAYH